MRTLIDIDQKHVHVLDELAKTRKTSRAALMRQAIADYVARQSTATDEAAFGLWHDMDEDGVAYQQRMRNDW